MTGVRQTDKGDVFIRPILSEGGQRIRANGQDLSATPLELFIHIPQARQLRAAIGSHKAAQERQHHGPPPKIGQTSAIALYIFKFNFGGKFPRGNEFTHYGAILLFSPKLRQTSSLLIFLSMYFAGSGDRNKGSIRRFAVDGKRHEKI